MSGKRKPALPVTNQKDPVVVAERLLRKVLPDVMYTDLCAKGSCQCIINDHTYTFSRKEKTKVEMDGKLYSCCIEFKKKGPPRQDQLAMEYLLALNDEARYLKTANLTDITPGNRGEVGPWGDPSVFRFGMDLAETDEMGYVIQAQIEALRLSMNPPMIRMDARRLGATEGGRIEAEQRYTDAYIRAAHAYRHTQVPAITTSMVCAEALRLFVRHESLRGLRYPVVPYGEMMDQIHSLYVGMYEVHGASSWPIEDYCNRLLVPVIERLVRSLRDMRGVRAIVHRPHRDGQSNEWARIIDPDGQWCMNLDRAYDVSRNAICNRFSMDFIVEPYAR